MCTEKLLQTEAFTHGSFFARAYAFTHSKLLHREAFAERNSYSEKLLHREAFAQKNLRTHEALKDRRLLHRKAFTKRSFCTERSFQTGKLSHRASRYTQNLLHREAFTQRSLCTEKLAYIHSQLLHSAVLTHRHAFTHSSLLFTEPFTQRSFYSTQKKEAFEALFQRKLKGKLISAKMRITSGRNLRCHFDVTAQI